jgi:hypothetical protein
LSTGFGEEFVAAHASEPGICDGHKTLLATEKRKAFLGGLDSADGIALIRQHLLEGKAHVFLVVHDEDWREGDSHRGKG